MNKYYALYPAPYGTTIKYLGKFENFDGASDKSDELKIDSFWILPENDLKGLLGSIQNELTKD